MTQTQSLILKIAENDWFLWIKNGLTCGNDHFLQPLSPKQVKFKNKLLFDLTSRWQKSQIIPPSAALNHRSCWMKYSSWNSLPVTWSHSLVIKYCKNHQWNPSSLTHYRLGLESYSNAEVKNEVRGLSDFMNVFIPLSWRLFWQTGQKNGHQFPSGGEFVEIEAVLPLHLSWSTALSCYLLRPRRWDTAAKPSCRTTYGFRLQNVNRMVIFWEILSWFFCVCASLAEALPVWP